MLYSASLREMMQNAVNENFWDAQNVEIEGRSIFEKKSNFLEKSSPAKKNTIFDALGGSLGAPVY